MYEIEDDVDDGDGYEEGYMSFLVVIVIRD